MRSIINWQVTINSFNCVVNHIVQQQSVKLSLIPQTLIRNTFPHSSVSRPQDIKGVKFVTIYKQQVAWRRDCELCDVVTADLVT